MTPLDHAQEYIARGWNPVPIPFREKGPKDKGWQTRIIDAENAPRYFNGGQQNIGIVLGATSNGLTDVDLDCDEARAIAAYVLPKTGAMFGRFSAKASHWLYYTDLATAAENGVLAFDDPERKCRLLELRTGPGVQTVFPGSTHPSGEPVMWQEGREPAEVTGADLTRRCRCLAAYSLLARYWPEPGAHLAHDAARVLGGFLARAGHAHEEIRLATDAISRAAGDSDPKDRIRAAEDAAKAHHDGGRAFGLRGLRDTFGKKVADRVAEWLDYEGDVDPAPEAQQAGEREEGRPPAYSDIALADRFAERRASDTRYVAAMGKWLMWNGARWLFDATFAARNSATRVCRVAAAECGKKRVASLIASARTVSAVERLAMADRRIAATVDQWDRDPWLLNTPAGIVDLRTGDIRPADPADHITKMTGVSPDADCPTPLWNKFLERITNGNPELIAFLQRRSGYALTGVTTEHALSFDYGTGGNGKTTFLNALIECMGDYHKRAPIETFTASNSDRHPTELAGLVGARLVTAVETEEGRRWAESRIKALTGGDPIAARFMRQDFFEYVPQFKLIIIGNHKPSLRSVDEAIKRRFHLVPFTVTISPEERDKDLGEKLKTELPGILAWMIQGCLDWQKQGLNPPTAVVEATKAYLDAEDATGAWIEECCERSEHSWRKVGELYASWSQWAEKNGEDAGTMRRFAHSLEVHGLTFQRRHGGRGYCGLKLKTSWRDEDIT
jgi:P4 family phage/plasmid primase-like protien